MEEQKKEVAIVEQGVPTVTALESSVQNAERYMQLQDKIRKTAILLTNQDDWIDQNGKPYLEWLGACKIARAFGVEYDEPSVTKEDLRDDKGEYIQYKVKGKLIHKSQGSVFQMGSCSTRDKFFGRKGGEALPLSEIDLGDIEKKATTNWLNRGIKSLLGLSYSWEEIEEYSGGKISRSGGKSVSYKGGSRGGSQVILDSPEIAEKRAAIMSMIMEMCGGDETMASTMLSDYTTFEKDGKKISGKKHPNYLTERQVTFLYGRLKKDYEETKGGQP